MVRTTAEKELQQAIDALTSMRTGLQGRIQYLPEVHTLLSN
jgi:hypothetical protein